MERKDYTKVFDVKRPARVSPSATSKPIIVGHHPMMADPMVRSPKPEQESQPSTDAAPITTTHKPKTIEVSEEIKADVLDSGAESVAVKTELTPAEQEVSGPPPVSETAEAPKAEPEPVITSPIEELKHPQPAEEVPGPPSLQPELPPEAKDALADPQETSTPQPTVIETAPVDPAGHKTGATVEELPAAPEPNLAHIPHMPVAQAHSGSRKFSRILLWLLIIAFLAALAGFLLVDAGIVKTTVKLPFHIFNRQV